MVDESIERIKTSKPRIKDFKSKLEAQGRNFWQSLNNSYFSMPNQNALSLLADNSLPTSWLPSG